MSPPGFDPRIIQSLASRYTDSAIRPCLFKGTIQFFFLRGCEYENYDKLLASAPRTEPDTAVVGSRCDKQSKTLSFLSLAMCDSNFIWLLHAALLTAEHLRCYD
jgi:hypothetical protein